jgi:lysozyme family protein
MRLEGWQRACASILRDAVLRTAPQDEVVSSNLRPEETSMNLTFDALRPEYEELWETINQPGGLTRLPETMREAEAIMAPDAKARFKAVELRTGVPWFVTGIVLTREAGSPPNFHTWLHNGDPMFDHGGIPRQTVNVPARRPLDPAVSWEDGAVDAYEIEGLLHREDWSPALVAWLLEKFNGFGYRLYHHVPSPYVWGATAVQQCGKYTADRAWDATVMDPQIGGMALLAALMKRDAEVRDRMSGVMSQASMTKSLRSHDKRQTAT